MVLLQDGSLRLKNEAGKAVTVRLQEHSSCIPCIARAGKREWSHGHQSKTEKAQTAPLQPPLIKNNDHNNRGGRVKERSVSYEATALLIDQYAALLGFGATITAWWEEPR